MNELYTLLLALGQRTVTEQTGNLFVKYLSKIEVLTSQPQKWDEPQANPAGGTVPAGTMVALSNLHTDEDKIHYTTDGSTPTMHSPVYNWIASRWWSSRTDVLGTINRPIGPLNENTTIKAITIGPGKRDSDIATFQYYIDAIGPGSGTAPPKNGAKPADGAKLPEQAARIIELTIGQTAASVNDKPYTLYAAPYINIPAGRMLVPIRFVSEALGAAVKWNPGAKEVTITAKGGEIILTLDSMNALVNGQATILECAPELQNNRTFVPLRFVSETLEAQVEYKAGKVIIIK
jgi:hypothetical protein